MFSEADKALLRGGLLGAGTSAAALALSVLRSRPTGGRLLTVRRHGGMMACREH